MASCLSSHLDSDSRILYLVRRADSGVYERLSKVEIEAGLACGEIVEEVCSDWVIGVDGRFVCNDNAKGYVRKK